MGGWASDASGNKLAASGSSRGEQTPRPEPALKASFATGANSMPIKKEGESRCVYVCVYVCARACVVRWP